MNMMWYIENLPAVPLISAMESQPRTFITLTSQPINVEQALFSVTDVSFAAPNLHFLQLVIARCQFALLQNVLFRRHLISDDRNALCRPKGLPKTLLKDSGSITTSCLHTKQRLGLRFMMIVVKHNDYFPSWKNQSWFDFFYVTYNFYNPQRASLQEKMKEINQ